MKGQKKKNPADFLPAEIQKLNSEDYVRGPLPGEDEPFICEDDGAPPLAIRDAKAALAALGRVYVSRVFRDAVLHWFPALRDDSPYWTLLCYLLFGSRHDSETKRLLLPAKLLSIIEGRDPYNSQAGEFLARFREEVLRPNGATIQWTGWNKLVGKCRQLRRKDFGDKFEELLRREYLGYWNQGERVYIIDGSRFNPHNARRSRREQREAAAKLPTLCEHAEIIRNYLNALPCNLFSRVVRENSRSAVKAMLNLPDSPVKDAQFRILRHIVSQPQPFYFPSEKGHTVRLSTREGIPNLVSNIRRGLTKGWLEADLRSSQFAIVATLWNLPELLDFLQSGQSLWKRLSDYLSLTPVEWEIAKPIIKQAIYSICYGMGQSNVKGLTAYDLVCEKLDKRIAHRLLEEPLIKALLKARDTELAKIAAANGALDCYGKWLPVEWDRQPRDIMAAIAQAWEMKLIYPAFELAQTTREFTITLFQHDGFSVHFTRRPEQWKPEIEKAISWNANRLGFFTWLEWT